MSQSLYYFVSTLPMLKLGELPPCSSAAFLEDCKSALTEKDAQALAAITLDVKGGESSRIPAVQQWFSFEAFLRNTTARMRSARLHKNAPAERHTDTLDAIAQKHIQDTFNLTSPAERETDLDTIRWQLLESLENGHQFDLDCVAIHLLKLLLLERIASRKLEQGMVAYNTLVEQGINQALAIESVPSK